MNKIATLAAALAVAAAAPALAGPTVTSITIQNSTGNYLQIAELQAFAGATNFALTGAASATSTWIYGGDPTPDKAIDGSTNGGFPAIYHGNASDGSDVFTLTLGQSIAIDRLSIYGRTDCCTERDLYSYTLLNGTDVVGRGTLDARGSAFATVAFESGAVPEPATWAMMLTGFGLVGFGLRRRRSVRVAFG